MFTQPGHLGKNKAKILFFVIDYCYRYFYGCTLLLCDSHSRYLNFLEIMWSTTSFGKIQTIIKICAKAWLPKIILRKNDWCLNNTDNSTLNHLILFKYNCLNQESSFTIKTTKTWVKSTGIIAVSSANTRNTHYFFGGVAYKNMFWC